MRDQDILFIALGLGAVAFFATQKGTPEKPVLVSPFDPPPWRPQGLTKAQQADVMEWDVPDVVKKGKGGTTHNRGQTRPFACGSRTSTRPTGRRWTAK